MYSIQNRRLIILLSLGARKEISKVSLIPGREGVITEWHPGVGLYQSSELEFGAGFSLPNSTAKSWNDRKYLSRMLL